MGFPGGPVVKNLPAVSETQVQCLCQEDPLEEGMVTHSSILTGRIPWTEEPGGLQSMRSQRVRYDWSDWACTHCMFSATFSFWFNILFVRFIHVGESESVSHSVMSNSLWLHGLQPARLLCPWNSPGKNTGVGNHFLLQGIFSTHASNPCLLHCRQILYHLSHQGSPLPS